MAPAMKRPAAASAVVGAAAKKAKAKAAAPAVKKDPVKKDPRLAKVVAGLQHLGQHNADCVRMMVAMVEPLLTTPKQDRDARMNEVVAMFEGVFEEERNRIEKEISEIERFSAEAHQVQDAQQAKIDKIAESVKAQVDEVKKQKYALADAARSFRTCKQSVETIEKEQKDAVRNTAAAAEKKAELEEAVSKHFTPLLSSVEDLDAAREEVALLSAVLRNNDFDDSLVTSLPTALVKAPETRGSFDMMVLTKFDDEVAQRKEAYAQILERAASEQAARDARLQSAQADFAKAKAVQLQQAEAFTKAQEEETRRADELQEAKSQLTNLKKEVSKLNLRAARAAKQSHTFNEGPMAAFLELRDLAPAPEATPEDAAQETAEDAAEEVAAEPQAMDEEPTAA